MVIHFSILIVILICSLIWEQSIKYGKLDCIYNGEEYDYKSQLTPWLIVFGYIAFLAAMRSDVNDTYAYISSFKMLGNTWNALLAQIGTITTGKDWGFDAISILFKMKISEDFHLWFLMYAAIESILLIHVFRKYSLSFFDTCFYFFCSTLYINYFTMMRQWFAVVVLFAAIGFIKDNKTLRYILLCVILGQIHTSAYFMIVVYFLVRGKAWSKKQNSVAVLFALGMFFLNPILSSLESSLSGATYNYVLDTMSAGSGSSPVRILIAAVPVGIALIERNYMDDEDDILNICINMSLFNLLLNILATFTSGLFIIRFSTYTNMFNLLLYPYLLNVAVSDKNRKIIKIMFYFLFFCFYIYQMNHGTAAWHYGSDILGVFE